MALLGLVLGPVGIYLVSFHPVSKPPILVIGVTGTGDRLARTGKIIELTGLHRFSNETIDQLLLRFALHEPRVYRNSASWGRVELVLGCPGNRQPVATDRP